MEQIQELKRIIENIDSIFDEVNNILELNNLKQKYLSKKGIITEMTNVMKNMNLEEKKEYGKELNNLRTIFTNKYEIMNNKFENELVLKKIDSEKIDISLPGTNLTIGSPHMLEKIIEEIEELFISMGYDIVEGPEVEKDLYNFEMLNLPKGHPARDAQDTFYITAEILLRSQTSPVQVRTMLNNNEKSPIRILCPGKTYRRDNDDATHSHQFTQIEGLLIDNDISLADLKGTFDIVAKRLFGSSRETRFRPSFYPFTEPSVELDISCFNCEQKGCHVCKNTGWITVGGAGIVHPNVLKMSGYDPDKVTGFAFGFGAERLAMLKYGISDIRTFYINDLRSNTQFDRRDV